MPIKTPAPKIEPKVPKKRVKKETLSLETEHEKRKRLRKEACTHDDKTMCAYCGVIASPDSFYSESVANYARRVDDEEKWLSSLHKQEEKKQRLYRNKPTPYPETWDYAQKPPFKKGTDKCFHDQVCAMCKTTPTWRNWLYTFIFFIVLATVSLLPSLAFIRLKYTIHTSPAGDVLLMKK